MQTNIVCTPGHKYSLLSFSYTKYVTILPKELSTFPSIMASTKYHDFMIYSAIYIVFWFGDLCAKKMSISSWHSHACITTQSIWRWNRDNVSDLETGSTLQLLVHSSSEILLGKHYSHALFSEEGPYSAPLHCFPTNWSS